MAAPPLNDSVQVAPLAPEQPLDLRALLATVLQYKWGILALACAMAIVAGFWVFSQPPAYRAQASLLLETAQAKLVGIEDVYSSNSSQYDYYQTQYEILKSRNLAERVVRRLQLHKHPYFGYASAEPEAADYDLNSLKPAEQQQPPELVSAAEAEARAIAGVTGSIVGGLTVRPVDYSYMVYLQYESGNPQIAADIVNTLASEYIESELETRTSGTVKATSWLNERLLQIRDKLRVSEQALQDFRDREQLVAVDGITSLGGNELTYLSTRLEEARKARIEAQNVKQEVNNAGKLSVEEMLTIPSILQHELIRGLKQKQAAAESRTEELGKRYGRKHPTMIAAQSELDAANRTLKSGVARVVSGISREFELARRNEQLLTSRWEEQRTAVQDFNRKEFELLELQREVDTNRQLYDVFFTRLKETGETSSFERPNARILDPALVPTAAITPDKQRTVVLAFMLGLMLGTGAALLLGHLDDTVKNPDDLLQKIGIPSLGVVPIMPADAKGSFEQYWENTQNAYAEALRSIRTALVLSSLDRPAKIIVLTSSVEGEGKSAIALNLGAALAQMEKTLIIGADLRRPSLATRCGLRPNHKGLSHFVSGAAELEECIEFLDASSLHVMPAGLIPANPLEMVSSDRFAQALATLRDKFDRIIIDSAPLGAVSDALILSSLADAAIFIIKANSTPASNAKRHVARMRASNLPLVGAILNQYDPRKAQQAQGGNNYLYDDYYSSQSEKQS
ncbi:polysaccharide biosynthesis tyrosine autokinase [Halieaceae bacterium IMCC14734]|uniref:non-specific protein-tyrosine kinase n=1 Tax=Candidatus Litorirhabdus singularis TaxID=2518993 RepID=A0ABT3TF29_9GAMM|nr:polysaccharide biosynthesis tyrosine autokinase [Candidatus Litorirhabdus singularis]MCX2980386.1 polysaccharide biosynthesis tyrosine autokinase [Candidatus Litorirhabdus singularis]